MKTYKLLLLSACAAFVFLGCRQTARASAWNERTILHVHNPIQIPGTVLTPGTYAVQLATPNTNQDVVQFIDTSNHHVVATVIAIPEETYPISGKTKLTFYEAARNNPPALRAWFYPGMQYGDEFVYPQSEAQTIAGASNRYVPAMSDTDMQNFQRQANSNTGESPSYNGHIYRAAPNGSHVSNEEGLRNNTKLDQNPSWKQRQQTYQHNADFGSAGGQ
jgi:hypothetical protein